MTRHQLLTAFTMTTLLGITPVTANTLEGTLNGEQREWTIIEARGGQSTASYSEIAPGMVNISIQGVEGTKYAVKGSLTLSTTLMQGKPVTPPEVSFFPEKTMLPNYSASKAESWEINTEPAGDGTMKVRGHYRGTLTRVEAIGQDPKSDDTMKVDVRFDILARKQQ